MDFQSATATIAANMRTLRRARGLTGAQVAEAMRERGIPWQQGVVTKLETGRRENVSAAELLALADIFGVEPMTLTQGKLEVKVGTVMVDLSS